MKQNNITQLQYGTLIFFLLNSFIINIGYYNLTTTSKTDSILDILIGGCIIILLGKIILYIQKNNQLSFLELIKKSRKSIKIISCLTLGSIILVTLIYHLSNITAFIHYYILKEVNLFTITVTLVITSIYIVSKNLSTISKISEVFFYIYIFIFIIGCIGVLKYIDISNIKPLLTSSFKEHVTSSNYFFSSAIIPLSLLLIIPNKNIKSNKSDKVPLIFIITFILLTFIQLICIISILGIKLANIYQNPDMIIFKKISFLNILERVEVMLSLNHILSSLFFIIMCIYVLKKLIEVFIDEKKEHITLSAIALLLIILNNIYKTNITFYLTVSNVILILVIIYFINTILSKYKNH